MDIVRKRKRIRDNMRFTTKRPRLSVHKSNKYIYAQLIEQFTGKVLTSYDTKRLVKDNPAMASKTLTERVKAMATELAKKIKKAGHTDIVFDRSGYKYHGKIKLLADTLRESGLNF